MKFISGMVIYWQLYAVWVRITKLQFIMYCYTESQKAMCVEKTKGIVELKGSKGCDNERESNITTSELLISTLKSL